ncbi:MAG: HipA family kinase [Polyangiales bacterium]
MALPLLHGFTDQGPIKEGATRWNPRRIRCTPDASHVEAATDLVVKFRDDRATSTAALISEVVAGHLLEAGRIGSLHRHLVSLTSDFAESIGAKRERKIKAGLHFGTVFKLGVDDGPPDGVDDVAKPQQVIDIYAFDVWLCNFDRNNEGNCLLQPNAGGKHELIASDQSDCFGGAEAIATGAWKSVLKTKRSAETLGCFMHALYRAGVVAAIPDAIRKVRASTRSIGTAIAEVPVEWWDDVQMEPGELNRALGERAERLEEFVPNWGTLDVGVVAAAQEDAGGI